MQRREQRAVAAAQRAVQRGPAPDDAAGEQRARDYGQHDGVEHQRVGILLAAGTDRARMAAEQGDAEAFFQRGDLARDGGLAQIKFFTGVSEAAGFGDGVKYAKFVPIHGLSFREFMRKKKAKKLDIFVIII